MFCNIKNGGGNQSLCRQIAILVLIIENDDPRIFPHSKTSHLLGGLEKVDLKSLSTYTLCFRMHCLNSQMSTIDQLLSEEVPNSRASMQIITSLVFTGLYLEMIK